MLDALYQFFYDLFSLNVVSSSFYDEYQISTGGGFTTDLPDYLSVICSLISLIFIIVLCCLFVYKIVRLIGGLIR